MIDLIKESLLYWDLTQLPSSNLRDLVEAVKYLKKKIHFKQIIITADNTVLPALITTAAHPNLGADVFIPATIRIPKLGANTIHRDHFITPEIVVGNIWKGEQLISIGHAIDGAISVGNGDEYDISYLEFTYDLKDYLKFS